MQDIYDIKWLMLWYPINIFWSLIFICLFILLYFFILNKKQIKQKEKVVDNLEVVETLKKDWIKILEELEKKIVNYDDEKFFSKVDDILRSILEERWYKNIKTMILDDLLKLDISDKQKDLFKDIYYREFEKTDTLEEFKKSIIERIKKEVLNW